MPQEIEKKYRVADLSILEGATGTLVDQGYFNGKTLRMYLRWRTNRPYLAIAGRRAGHQFYEEISIPRKDAAQLSQHWTGRNGELQYKKLTLRGRVMGKRGFLTIKSHTKGIARAEFEYPLVRRRASYLLDRFATEGRLTKRRFLVPVEQVVFEVDKFLGKLLGGYIAEVELKSEDARVPIPTWLGEEVTDDPRLRNSALAVAERFPA